MSTSVPSKGSLSGRVPSYSLGLLLQTGLPRSTATITKRPVALPPQASWRKRAALGEGHPRGRISPVDSLLITTHTYFRRSTPPFVLLWPPSLSCRWTGARPSPDWQPQGGIW